MTGSSLQKQYSNLSMRTAKTEGRKMKETLTTGQITDRLLADENAAWSYEGARALAEYLEDMEANTGEEMEFDRVAIRCDYAEYSSAMAAASDYNFTPDDIEPGQTDEEKEETALDWLRGETDVIEFDGGVIIRAM